MRDDIIQEARTMWNHVGIIADMELGRLVGIGEDDMDTYYIVRMMDRDDSGKRERWYSCVMSFESLKSKIARYDAMDNIFQNNNAPKSEKFLLKTTIQKFNLNFSTTTTEVDVDDLANFYEVAIKFDFALLNKIIDWCVENNIRPHSTSHRGQYLHSGQYLWRFEKKDDAALFKLFWSA